MHKIVKNIITDNDISYLKSVYDRESHIHTQGMEKVRLPYSDNEFMSFIKEVIDKRLGLTDPYEIVGDNFYRHQHSYFPHCDAVEHNAWLNIVIPLELEQTYGQQKFIVFDQTWLGRNATWIGNYNMQGDFESNKKIITRPCDSNDCIGLTDEAIPNDLWIHVFKRYFDKDYFYGLSGTAYDWIPGDIILFDSRHIHTTGTMQCKRKLGISIRIVKK